MKLFSEKEVVEIYNNHIKRDDSYYNKSHKRYFELSDSDKKKFFNIDFPRVASIFDFKDWIEKYDLKNVESILSTYRDDYELEYVNSKSITYVEYGENGQNDLHTLNIEKKDFDFIIVNQTFEHLYNPFLCVRNLFDHLKPGGYLYTTAPTINIPHMVPFHFWGITPIGLCILGKSAGFEICECGFWGNLEYLNYIFTQGRWPNNGDVFDVNGIIKNNDLCQAQTWVLLQKPI